MTAAARGGDPPPAPGAWPCRPQPLDAPPLPADCARRPPRGLRRLAGQARQPVLRQGDRQPGLEQLLRPGPDPSRGRPAGDQPAQRRGPAGLAGRRFRRPPLRRQAPDPDDHDLGGLRPVERPRRRATSRTRSSSATTRSSGSRPRSCSTPIVAGHRGARRRSPATRRAGGASSCPTTRSRAPSSTPSAGPNGSARARASGPPSRR